MNTHKDVFMEELVVRHSARRIMIIKIMLYSGSILLFFTLDTQIRAAIPAYSEIFTPILLGLIVWGGWYSLRFIGTEFEYSFYSGDVDVDRITGKRRRTRELSFSCKDIEAMAPYTQSAYSRLQGERYELKLDTRGRGKGEKDWYIICRSHEGKKTLMVFSPSPRMIAAFRQYVRGTKLY